MAQKLASPGIDAHRIEPTRICAGSADSDIDDQGNEYELCPDNDHGHLYFHGWCVHCNREAPE